ncbi:MAG TPA: PAS domain S-box protein [Bacteroidota bacterium]|nr:PAS domain S-box protein [Bacteroidota bacterium]
MKRSRQTNPTIRRRKSPGSPAPRPGQPGRTPGKSELFFQQLFENSPEGVVFLDKDDRVLSINRAFTDIFGYTLEELRDKDLADFIVPRDLLRESTDLLARTVQRETVQASTMRKRKDGSPVFVSIIGSPIMLGRNKIGVCAMYRDISAQKQAEDNLRESERRYRTLVESADDLLYTADTSGHFLYANRVALKITGYSEQEILGKQYLELIRQDFRPSAEAFYKGQVRTGTESTYFEFPIKSKTGTEVWLGQHVQLIKERSRVTGIQAIARDITDRKMIEAALRESEERLQKVIDTVNDGITFSDESGHFLVFNKTMENLTGYSVDEANAGDFSALLYPNPSDRQRALDGLKELLETKVLREVESTITTKSGEQRVILTSTSLLELNGHKMFLSAYRDITLRRIAQKALEESEARFRGLYDDAPVGYHELDAQGRIVRVNRKELEMLGYRAEEMIGQEVWKFSEDSKTSQEAVRAKLAGTVVPKGSYERTLLTKRGMKLPVLVDEHFVRDQAGKVTGIRTIIQDISLQKQAAEALREAKEAAETATRAKSQFLAVMSHEIRTPMNGVIGMTDLLLHTELSEEQKDYVETIKTSGETLLSIINDILDFSKIESGKIELEHHSFELKECIEEVFELLAPKAVTKSLDLLYWIDPRVPPIVVGDKLRLRQIFFNLIGNAIKFTEKGEVYASVTLDWRVANECQLHFAVKDTGIGIPKDRADRLFKAFSQVDSSTTRKYGGTGLGLAISTRLVELMGGRIWVESDEGKGSTFTFTAKIGVPGDTVALPTVVVRAKVPELQGKRVLIVDDNSTNLRVLQLQCEYWGMVVRTTNSPHEALEWVCKGDPFDIAILDMLMPNMNGIQLAAEIAKQRPKESLPLLLLTSTGTNDENVRRNAHLFSSTVSKPVKQDDLFNHIVSLLSSAAKTPRPKKPVTELEKKLSDAIPLRILVAEDNEINQKLFVHILRQLGYTAHVVGNGSEAIRELERNSYDIVFMDVHMPELDGLEATRRIVSRWSATERPKIIALTADALQGDREKCIAAGMDDYLAKPIVTEDVRKILELWSGTVRQRVAPAPAEPVSGSNDLAATITKRLHEFGFDQDSVFMIEFLGVAMRDIGKHRQRAIQAVQDKDAKGLRYAMHTLKGASSNFGPIRIVEICRQIEDAPPDQAFGVFENLRSEFDEECDKVVSALQSIQNGVEQKARH